MYEINKQLPEVVVTPRVNYISYSGNESYSPDILSFIKSKIDEKKATAVSKILKQKQPLIPKVPNRNIRSTISAKLGMSDKERIQKYGYQDSPATCIYTATSMYGPDSTVTGNKTFTQNPEKYGFTLTDSPQIGDLAQFYSNTNSPVHMTVVTGFNDKNQPALSYSNGEVGEWTDPEDGTPLIHNMKYDNDNWNPNWKEDWDDNSLYSIGTPKYYKYIGTKDDFKNWLTEYHNKYGKTNTKMSN